MARETGFLRADRHYSKRVNGKMRKMLSSKYYVIILYMTLLCHTLTFISFIRVDARITTFVPSLLLAMTFSNMNIAATMPMQH